jgi:hypothetical protein
MRSACAQCGLALAPGDAFCGTCGQPVGPENDGAAAAGLVSATLNGEAGEPELPRTEAYAWRVNYAELSGEPTFDPLANTRFLWQVVRQAALFVALYVLAEIVIGIVCLVLAIAGAGFGAAFSLWGIIATIVGIVITVLFWFTPIPALLAQQSRLLRSCSRAPAALEAIRQLIVDHATPHDSLRIREMSPPGEGRRDYLELRRGHFSGVVSCFQHGTDLYVGWTFWIYLSPLRLILMFIGRKIQDRTGRGNDMYQTLRYDSTRATVAALYSSVNEVAENMAGSGAEVEVPAATAAAQAALPGDAGHPGDGGRDHYREHGI